jgi:hypothetical protein
MKYKNNDMGFHSRTRPNWSFLGQDIKKKEFNSQVQMPRMILTISQNIQKYSYLSKANILKIF